MRTPPIPKSADGGKPISLSTLVDKTKGTFLDEIKEINECSNQYIYTKIKIQQNFDKYSNYLGLISDKSLIPNKIESEKKEELGIKNAYFNDAYIILYDNGLLMRRQGEIILRKIIEDYSDIKEDEINEIDDYLKGLQVYWKNRYHKFLLKPNLKKRKDFNEDVMKFTENLKKDFKEKSKEDYSKREYLAYYSGKYEEAIEYNDKILELNPKDEKAWLNKGFYLANLGRYEEAIECLDEVLKIDPNYTGAWSNKGVALQKLDRYEEAIKYYDKALEIDPNYKYAWTSKGVALQKLDRYEEAIKYYDKALEIDPNYKLAWHNKGIALFDLERYEEAIKCYDKALEIDPNYKLAWNSKGVALQKLDRYEEAIKCYDKTLEIDRNYALTFYNKACLESLRNNKEKSIEFLKKAIELDNKLRDLAKIDSDFDNIRESEDFKDLVGK